MSKYLKPSRFIYVRGVGLVNQMEGMSFNPFNVSAIASSAGLWFLILVVLPILAGLAISVLQSIFPWWPR